MCQQFLPKHVFVCAYWLGCRQIMHDEYCIKDKIRERSFWSQVTENLLLLDNAFFFSFFAFKVLFILFLCRIVCLIFSVICFFFSSCKCKCVCVLLFFSFIIIIHKPFSNYHGSTLFWWIACEQI